MRKNASKKVITFMLAAAMAVTAVPAGVFADEMNTASQQSAADTETNDVSVQSGAFEAAEGDEQIGAEAESEQTVAESESTDGQTPKSEEPEGGADTSENEIQTYAEDVDYGVESVNISGVDQTTGAFAITISGVTYPGEIERITVPVWSKEDQSDICWYTASKADEDTYVVNGNVSNHGYAKGTYNVHTYIEDKDGGLHFVNKAAMDASVQNSGVAVESSGSGSMNAGILISGNTIFGRGYDVQFAVWSEANGQDDIVWYGASESAGTYSTDFSLASHSGTGIYNVHCYARLDNGVMVFIGKTTFEVAKASVSSVDVSGVDQNTGAFTVTVSGVNAPSGVKNITVPVWSKEDQSDIYWYTASRKEDGTYVVNGNVSNHKYNKGTYNVHTYVENSRGELEFVNKTTMDVSVQASEITVSEVSDSQRKAAVSLDGNTIFGKNYQIQFAVWSETGGQDDIIWYNAKGASGTYSADISIASHKGTGVYNVHGYAKLDNGTMIFLSKTTFEVAKASASSVSVSEINKNTGAFKVTVSGLSSPFGVKEVTVPVWSREDQSDIYWYTAVKQSDGTYVADCNLSRHSYNMGTYNIHAYVENSMGTLEFLGKTTAEVNGGKLSVSKSSDLYYTASISDIMGTDDIKSLQFAVWSITGGQDDIIWYDASLKDGVYSADIDITNHMTTGKYAVHAYAKLKNGSSKFITGIEFNVDSIPGSSVQVTGTGNGTFDITVTPVIKSSKYKEISIPVWSEAGGQDDIIWYKGVKQADGTYKASVNVKDHGYGAGVYNVHSYAVLTDGSMTFLAKTSYTPSVQNIVSTTKLSDSCVRVTVHGASCNGTAASSVRFAVWSEAGGQDDIQWLEGTKGSDGSFYTDVYRSDFESDGIYISHVYTYAGGGSQLCSTAVTFSLYYPTDYDSYAASVMRNIIYAVETGGQIYGNARYDDFTAAYTNSKSELAITIGAGCWYATEAQRLLSLIRSANPTGFAQLDSAGIGNDLDTADWSTYGSDGTVLSDSQSIADGYSHRTITAGSEKALAIQKIISTDTGKEIQDQLVDEQMSQYVQEAAELGVADLKARMFCANLRHLGGYGGMSRVIGNCVKDGLELTMDNLWATMLKYDTGNQVGGPIYRTRHQKVMQWLNKYIG